MSILSNLIESAGATMPFADARSVSVYKNRDRMSDFQNIENEVLQDLMESEPVRIKGLGHVKKRKSRELTAESVLESLPPSPKKKKKHPNLEEVVESKKKAFADDDTIIPVKKSSSFFSSLCDGAESKAGLDDVS